MPAIAASAEHSDALAAKTRPKLWSWLELGVIAATALLYFARLGSRALWSSEERWADIAREMHLSANYFWPTINGQLYFDKPLLSYWMVLTASHVTGSIDEAATRVPCAIAGICGVVLLIVLARQLYASRATSALAGFILATSFSFVFFSRHASADVETITGELAALVVFLRYRERPGGPWIIALWLIMALTSLTKGLLGFALPLVVAGSYSCLSDGWEGLSGDVKTGSIAERAYRLIARNRWFLNWWTVLAAAIAASLYLLPFAISQTRMHSQAGLYMVYRENVLRFFHPFDHRGPIYLYAYVVFTLLAPWSILLPAALAQAHRRATPEVRNDRFALVFFWATFIFFTASGSRRSYYILPILPAAALLIARLLTSPTGSLSTLARRLMWSGFAILAIATAAASILLLPPSVRPAPWSLYPATPYRAGLVVFWLIAIAAVIVALRDRRPIAIARAFAIVAYVAMGYTFLFAMPAADAYRPDKPFAIQVRQFIGGDLDSLAFYKTEGPVFYLASPTPIPTFGDSRQLADSARSGRVRWVICKERSLSEIQLPGKVVLSEQSYPWQNADEVSARLILLKLG